MAGDCESYIRVFVRDLDTGEYVPGRLHCDHHETDSLGTHHVNGDNRWGSVGPAGKVEL